MAKIALDIDSTLHHYWPLLDGIVRQRFGIALPYDEQRDWGITELDREQIIQAVHETHSEENILGAEPYPDAVETVTQWHDDGHWIHITSHRHGRTRGATERWLDKIGLPYDDLHCSFDKVTRCVELGIDVLVDDSPVNLSSASEHGIVAATIVHPWNEDLVNSGAVIGASDWRTLRDRLEPVLRGGAQAA